MQPRQTLGVLGAFCLAVGAFAPVVSLPEVGGITYVRSGNGVMLAIGLIALALSLRNHAAWLLPVGLTAMATIITTVRSARSLVIAGPPNAVGIAEAPPPVQLDWGLAVLAVGTLLLFVAAFMKPRATAAGAPAETHLPRLVLITTVVIAAVLMGTVWLWPTGTFILLQR
ncbi:MAG: hypothetical protein FJW14_03980 [Acidimicrobiia bacterium]|nr:hypothetical protein [Acidimicrobiia bacterium]